MQQQIALLASSSDSVISAWDINTGMQLASFKSNAAGRNCLTRAGADYLVAAQSNKDALQFWTWHKDQFVQRSFTMEKMNTVAVSPDGALLAAGGMSGALYIWELSSGRLLRTWPAHYKAVTALVFSGCSCMLVSGSEDTLVSVWLLADILDAGLDPNSAQGMRPQPLQSWSDHTLPVTGLYITTTGSQAASIIASSSLDRTVKLHALHNGTLLAVANLPASAMCVAMDAGEHVMYVGGADGVVYEFSLVGEVPEVDLKAGSSAASGLAGSGMDMQTFGGAHATLRPHARMSGHVRAINCLAVSTDGELLVSGSEDGTATVWDVRSRQAVRTLSAPNKLPVSCVLVMPRPVHLTPGGGGSAGSGIRTGPTRLSPLAPLVKYIGMSGNLKPWESAPVILDGSSSCLGNNPGDIRVNGILVPPQPVTEQSWLQSGGLPDDDLIGHSSTITEDVFMVQGDGVDGVGTMNAVNGLKPSETADVESLTSKLAAAQKEIQQWKAMHAQLHAFCVQHVVGPGIG